MILLRIFTVMKYKKPNNSKQYKFGDYLQDYGKLLADNALSPLGLNNFVDTGEYNTELGASASKLNNATSHIGRGIASTALPFMMAEGGLIPIQNGGTHEQNPNGGVPIGPSATVEEGETIDKNFVFSDRLVVDVDLANEFNLPKKAIGKTFAEVSKMYEDGERPNDSISKRGYAKEIANLKKAQEAFKQVNIPQEQTLPNQMNYGGLISTDGLNEFMDADLDNVEDLSGLAPEQSFKFNPNDITKYGSLARFAPVVGSAINLSQLEKPTMKETDMFDTNMQFTPNLIDAEQIGRDIESQGEATRNMIRNTRGNQGSTMANLLASQLQTDKAKGAAQTQIDSINNQELARTQGLTYDQAMRNAMKAMQVQQMNDMDLGTYEGLLMDSTASLAQNLGAVGSEFLNLEMVKNLPSSYQSDLLGQVMYNKNKKPNG